jgi:two-component system copper resistance phosphate regulon response regulator CusR
MNEDMPVVRSMGNSVDESTVTQPSHRVLVVDDDVPLGKFLNRELSHQSFSVTVLTEGEGACEELQRGYDVVILDLNLPGIDGVSVLKKMRASDPRLPILVLTARKRTDEMVQVLEQGADDYLIKPFSLLELRARLNSLLRRNATIAPRPKQVAELVLQPEGRRVLRNGRTIDLTPREFAILECLIAHAGQPVSRSTLMEEVWKIPLDPSTNVVDVYMKYLRDKIDDPGEPKLIRTVRGVGYILSYV